MAGQGENEGVSVRTENAEGLSGQALLSGGLPHKNASQGLQTLRVPWAERGIGLADFLKAMGYFRVIQELR